MTRYNGPRRMLSILPVLFLAMSAVFGDETSPTPITKDGLAGCSPIVSISYPTIAANLTALDHLAQPPWPGMRSGQFSSRDQRSIYNPDTGVYEFWDANKDGDGYIRKEGEDTYVIAEMRGPGCIQRIWAATPWQEKVEIYLDGATEPVLSIPFTQYFGAGPSPFNMPGLCYTVEAGGAGNCYIPIPYRVSCKVIVRGTMKRGYFYQIGYVTYPDTYIPPVFALPLPENDTAALQEANDALLAPPFEGTPAWVETLIRPGATVLIDSWEGAGAITSMLAWVDLPGDETAQRKVLRELTINICWDGEEEPSIWAPLGDFFGSAPGLNPYEAYPMGVTDNGVMYSRWHMPFSKGAMVRVTNNGATQRNVRFAFATDAASPLTGSLARFHAKWHRDIFPPTEPSRAIDWPFLKTTGQGRYVGLALHVYNPLGGWWGEGDEKLFVDGEKFPSIFGTGTEDYFGYSWGSPALFACPFHAQTLSMNVTGHVSNCRWQVADSVAFQTGFEGCVEKYLPNDYPTLYAATAYWYLMPGGDDPYQPTSVEDRLADLE